MPTNARLSFYAAFIVALAVWTGGGVFLILVVTALYFVPTLIKLADHQALTDAQITSMSLLWMRLNAVRIVVLLALLTYSLVGLIRLVRPRAGTLG